MQSVNHRQKDANDDKTEGEMEGREGERLECVVEKTDGMMRTTERRIAD